MVYISFNVHVFNFSALNSARHFNSENFPNYRKVYYHSIPNCTSSSFGPAPHNTGTPVQNHASTHYATPAPNYTRTPITPVPHNTYPHYTSTQLHLHPITPVPYYTCTPLHQIHPHQLHQYPPLHWHVPTTLAPHYTGTKLYLHQTASVSHYTGAAEAICEWSSQFAAKTRGAEACSENF